MLKFKILKYLPPYGPLPEQFTFGPTPCSEGFVVEFYPEKGEKWVGNFLDGLSGISDAIVHPNGKRLIVIANGQAYVVDPETRELVTEFGGQIEYSLVVRELQEVVFGNGLWFTAIGPEGLRWQSRRLSWDGMRSIQRRGTALSGESFNPMCNSWAPFPVNLTNGTTEGGSYSEDEEVVSKDR